MEIIKAVLFGIVEGITEWLPVSSTGHMILLDEFIQLKGNEEFINVFLVVIQLGAIFAVVLLFEKTFLLEVLSKANSAVRRIYTLTILGLSFAVFALEDLSHLFGYLKAMLFQNAFSDSLFPFYASRYSLLLLLLVVASTPYPYRAYRKLKMKKGSQVIFAALEGVLFILCLAYIVDGAYNPFLYFRF